MCLKYMENVKDQQNFRFCAIPQVMAVGTLALCFNNHKVFSGEPAGGPSVLTMRLTRACCVCYMAFMQDCFNDRLVLSFPFSAASWMSAWMPSWRLPAYISARSNRLL